MRQRKEASSSTRRGFHDDDEDDEEDEMHWDHQDTLSVSRFVIDDDNELDDGVSVWSHINIKNEKGEVYVLIERKVVSHE